MIGGGPRTFVDKSAARLFWYSFGCVLVALCCVNSPPNHNESSANAENERDFDAN